MTAIELRRIMGKIRTNPVKLAHELGTTATQVHRWRYGEDTIPDHVAFRLRIEAYTEATTSLPHDADADLVMDRAEQAYQRLAAQEAP
jgi:hypothetical protein